MFCRSKSHIAGILAAAGTFLLLTVSGPLTAQDNGPPVPGYHSFVMSTTKSNAKSPPERMGGPVTISASQSDGAARFILPGTRQLDPAVFGTPENPSGIEKAPFPMSGVSPDLRLTVNGEYSIVDHATPFSDWYEETTGSVSMTVKDVTAIDGASTKDVVDFEANFELPDGAKYRVVVNRPLAHGMAFPFFGGVVTNHLIQGNAEVAPRLLPTTFAYAAFWCVGDVYKDGQLINEGQLVHAWLSDNEKGPDGGIRTDAGAGASSGLTLHLLVPPFKPTPQGIEKSPLKTMFMPFPYVKPNIQKEMKAAKQSGDQARIEEVKQIQTVMSHTKERVVKATAEGKMFGMPFIHIKFDDMQVE